MLLIKNLICVKIYHLQKRKNQKEYKMIDLHLHTKFSDGTDSVQQLVDKIIDSDIKIFSITDHDTIKGCQYIHNNLRQKLSDNNIKFINGIEFSTRLNDSSVHILAYDFSLDNEVMLKLIKEGQELRKKRTLKRIELLNSEFNIKFSDEELDKILKMDNPGRPHIAQVLVKMGYGRDPNVKTEKFSQLAFACINKYLYHELKEFSVPSDYLIKELKKAKILSVMAHPLTSKTNKMKVKLTAGELKEKLDCLTKCGLDGLECYYSEYNNVDRELLLTLAKENNLLISGGSDYHGKNKSVVLGCLGTDIENVDKKEITLLKEIKSLN